MPDLTNDSAEPSALKDPAAAAKPIRSALKIYPRPGQADSTHNSIRSSAESSRSPKKGKAQSLWSRKIANKEPSLNAWAHYAEQQKREAKVKGKAVVIGRVSSRKLPDHVPKVNSKWDGLPTDTAGVGSNGPLRSNKSRGSSQSSGTTTNNTVRFMDDPIAALESSRNAPPQFSLAANPYRHQRDIAASISTTATDMTTSTLASDTESELLSSGDDEPRVVCAMLSSSTLPLQKPAHKPGQSDGTAESDRVVRPGKPAVADQTDGLALSNHHQQRRSNLPRPIHSSGTIGAISAWPMPPKSNRASMDSTASATPPSIPRKIDNGSLPQTTIGLASFYIEAELDSRPAARVALGAISSDTQSIVSRDRPALTMRPDQLPAVRSLQAMGAPSPASTPLTSSSTQQSLNNSFDIANSPEIFMSPRAAPIPRMSRPLSRQQQEGANLLSSVAVALMQGPRPTMPSTPPRSVPLPSALPILASSTRNFARPFSPTNPPPESKPSPTSPSRANSRSRVSNRSPARRHTPKTSLGCAVTDNSLPTILEADNASLRSSLAVGGVD